MITTLTEYNEAKTNGWYRGYQYIKNQEKTPGEDGLWFVPELYWRKFGNKIEKGFETVSMKQCREAIDSWFDFSQKTTEIKN